MNIIRTNADTTNKREMYRLTKGAGANVKDFENGSVMQVGLWALYSDTYKGRDGSESTRDVLSVLVTDVDGNGGKISTISPTFIRSFLEVVDLMEDEVFSIVIVKSTSKGGREFVNCELYCD